MWSSNACRRFGVTLAPHDSFRLVSLSLLVSSPMMFGLLLCGHGRSEL